VSQCDHVDYEDGTVIVDHDELHRLIEAADERDDLQVKLGECRDSEMYSIDRQDYKDACAQRDQALTALRAWRRVAKHLEERQHTVPLWAALLWDLALNETELALGDET
jgi:hypothetical protein